MKKIVIITILLVVLLGMGGRGEAYLERSFPNDTTWWIFPEGELGPGVSHIAVWDPSTGDITATDFDSRNSPTSYYYLKMLIDLAPNKFSSNFFYEGFADKIVKIIQMFNSSIKSDSYNFF